MGQYADQLAELNTYIDREDYFINAVNGGVNMTITIQESDDVNDVFTYTGTGGYVAAAQAWLDANPSLDGSNGTETQNGNHGACTFWVNSTEAERNALVAPRNARKTEFVQDRDHIQVIVNNGENTENLPGDND
tara:strand:- start:295 stop:696 length:402 start_codon:yes stop_codon:yes gene_type:complete